jgi:hypothetical protein
MSLLVWSASAVLVVSSPVKGRKNGSGWRLSSLLQASSEDLYLGGLSEAKICIPAE